MGFATLPPELVCMVAQELQSLSDVNALLRTSKHNSMVLRGQIVRMAKGSIPVFAAILMGNKDLLDVSIKLGLDLQEVWEEGQHIKGFDHEYVGYDPIMLASALGRPLMMTMLLDAGARIREGDVRCYSCDDGPKEAFENATSVEAGGRRRLWPLHMAVCGGNLDAVKTLYEAGGGGLRLETEPAGVSSGERWSLLHELARHPRHDIVYRVLRWLRDKGDVMDMINSGSARGGTPLEVAVRLGHFRMAMMLLRIGADPRLVSSARRASGNTIATLALESCMGMGTYVPRLPADAAWAATWLVDRGRDIDRLGRLVTELQRKGVDMDTRFGVRVGGPAVSGTVLHWAVRIGDVGVIGRLVGEEAGGGKALGEAAGRAADIAILDHNGESAIDVARRTSPRRTGYNWMRDICSDDDGLGFAGTTPLGDLASHHTPLLEKV